MVRRFFKFFDRELGGLHQAALFLALAAIASKLLALLRDRFLASTFGAGRTLDIYYASFVIPDYLYAFLLFIVSAWAIIPIFLEKSSRSQDEGRIFLNGIFTLFFIVTTISVVILYFLIPYFTPLVAPGFSSAEIDQAIALSRILLLSPFLLGLSNLVSSVIQSFRKFFIYALAPVFYNVGIILGVLIFYRWWGLAGVAWGVILGALFHFSIQIPSLLKANFFPKFTSKINLAEIKKIIRISFARGLALTLNQIVLTSVTALASFLGSGSIAVFNLAVNLQNIPLTVIGMSYGIAAFPILAQFHVRNEREEFIKHIIAASRHIIFWSFPVTALFIILRAQIVRVVLGAGAFSWADTRLTAASLAFLSIAIAGQGLMFLLVRAYYASGRTKRPLIINLFSSLFTVAGSFLFLSLLRNFENFRYSFNNFMRVKDVAGAEMLGLPLIFSLGAVLNVLLLWFFFQKDFGEVAGKLKKTFIDMFFASLIIGIVAYFFLGLFSEVLDIRTFIGIFLQGLFSGIIGISAGILFLILMKNRELGEVFSSLRQKIFTKTPESIIVGAEPEKLE